VWGGCNFVVSEERQENIDMMGCGSSMRAIVFDGSLFDESVGLWVGAQMCTSRHTWHLFQLTGQCVRCAHCCRVTDRFAPRGASYPDMLHGIRHEDSVGCPSGNVVGRCVRVPETIGSHRLAPAIQEMFAFQAKVGGMVGNGGNHIPDFPP
jgi:hypothetical protein